MKTHMTRRLAPAAAVLLIATAAAQSAPATTSRPTRTPPPHHHPPTPPPHHPATFYVATNGRDTWSGRLAEPNRAGTDGPFATVEAARKALRTLPAGKPRTVLLRGGVYRLAQPLVFGPEDSGTEAVPTTFAAYPGERPVLSGGRVVTGFRQSGKLWTATVPGVKEGRWYFRQLFVNGQRRPRARIPNEGYLRMAGPAPAVQDANGKEVSREKTAFTFRKGDLKPWSRLGDVNIVLMHSWENSIHPIKSVDTATNVLELAAPLKEWWKIGYWEREARYFVDNVYEGLDRPGEWYLDRETGVLTYSPMPGEQIGKTEAVAPALPELARFEGNPDEGRFVKHVRLEGLSFRHNDWVLAPTGNSSTQAAVETSAAITADGALGCAVEGCELAHLGTYALWLRRGCKECRVVRNEIRDVGAGGIRLGETKMAAEDVAETSRTLVENNYIHHYGEVYTGAIGVWVAHSSDNRIRHNEIHDGNYTGISLGWNWSDAPTRTLRNLVELNHIHHVGKGVMSDLGGIYTLGRQTGCVLRNNLIHDVFAYERPALAWGIYHDAGSNGILDEGNVCYNILSGGIMNTGLFGNVVRNNIFALGARQLAWRYKRDGDPPTPVERNIFLVTQGDLFNMDPGKEDFVSPWDHNLYWRTDGKPLTFYGMAFAEWQAKGVDRNSLVADPQFVDASKHDFRLKPTSPAITQLGFKPVDVSRCGLYGDREWVEKPRRVKHAPTVLPGPPPPPPPRLVKDDFERTPDGGIPLDATLFGDDAAAGASIRVSTETAFSGKHALKVVDSPALKEAYNPHFFYTPHLREGVARLSFRLHLKPGADVAVEWRTGGYPFRVGPSLRVDPAGKVLAGGKAVAEVPHEEWVGFEVRCGLGKAATGKWALAVTVPGREPQTFAGLACGSEGFDVLDWLGFISLATERVVFYVDDVKLDIEGKAAPK